LAVAGFIGSAMLFPLLGTSFIPELKEGTLSPNMDRVPNIALNESIKMEMEAQREMQKVPGITRIVSRLGRGESPVDPAGYNETDVMAQLAPLEERDGRTQDEITDEVRQKLVKFPGVNVVMAQPISDRVAEMVTGVRADIAVKIFGDDFDALLKAANQVSAVAHKIQGASDIKVDRILGQQNLNITLDRQAIARRGMDAADVNDVIESAIGGRAVTEIYEGERRFNAVVRFPEQYRNNVNVIRGLRLQASDGAQLPLESVADIRLADGVNQIRREMAKRRVVVAINVENRDLGGFVTELQQKVGQVVKLPSGY
jgi:cobalt-zinc-cadmium resistance protein CzcA